MPHAGIDLQAAALEEMIHEGFTPDFPAGADAQIAKIRQQTENRSGDATDSRVRDLRSLLWSSIDNDTSRDLEQLTVAEAMPEGALKIVITIAAVTARRGDAAKKVERQVGVEPTSNYHSEPQLWQEVPSR